MSSTLEFSWQALSVVSGGSSVLDINYLELKSESEAYQFVLNYGFDLYEPGHCEQIQSIYLKSIDFLEKYICNDGFQLPVALKTISIQEDFKLLLLAVSAASHPASETRFEAKLRPWICSILRVMHVVSHLQSDLRLKYLPKIKRQTIDRLVAHIQQSESAIFLGFESDKVPLVAFHRKESKVKDAVLMKLLHKPSATAQEVYDHIGVRFVTKNRVDAIRVIQYLVDHHLIAYPNVMSVRCRNTLVDISEFQKLCEEMKGNLESMNLAETSLKYPKSKEGVNPFSAEDFRSIQFTARHLIRIPVIRKGGLRREMTFFFPVEIQIFDEESYKTTIGGEAAHDAYKQKQLGAVRQRVLRGVPPL